MKKSGFYDIIAIRMKENESKYVLALDQGTTGTRAIIFNESGEIAGAAYKEFRQIYPQPGWVEHDPTEILHTVYYTAAEALKAGNVSPEQIEAMGIANQRETVVAWDSETGAPLYNAVVWQCRRSADECRRLIEAGCDRLIYEKTGLMPDAYFSATKMKWLLENVPQVREAANEGRLRFGTIDTYLMFKLSGGKIYATDYTNAARTMLFNIHKREWDADLLQLFSVKREMLPSVEPSGHAFGYAEKELIGKEIPICAVAGDQQAALFGQHCFAPGAAKCTFGTGLFLLSNTGGENVNSKQGLITTLASDVDGLPCYALEGSVFTGGAAIQWLRDEMKLLSSAAESEQIAASVPDSGGVYVVPAFVGLGAPYWDSDARGTICGITRGTKREHIVRATLESIAYQCFDVLHAMERDTSVSFTRLAVDGGASANNFLMQFLADITGVEIIRPRVVETTALGAAMLAAHIFGGATAAMLQKSDFAERIFKPRLSKEKRDELIWGWKTAVARARHKP